MLINICQKEGHNYRRINSICFESKCSGKRACCQQCLIKFHKYHIDQSVDIDDLLNYIRTQSKNSVETLPKVIQVLQDLTQVQNHLDALQKLVKCEIERISSLKQKNVCKGIGSRYHILESQVQGLQDDEWSELAKEMLRDFKVEDGQIIQNYSILNELDEGYQQFFKQFEERMTETDSKVKVVNEKMENRINTINTINFKRFIDKSQLSHNNQKVHSVYFCSSMNLLASGSSDGVRLWDLENNSLLQTYQQSSLGDIILSNDGNYLAYTYEKSHHNGFSSNQGEKKVKLVYIKNKHCYDLFDDNNQERKIYTFSQDSKRLISSCKETVIITDCQSLKEILRLIAQPQLFALPQFYFQNNSFKINYVTISGDDTLLASSSNDGYIRIWNLLTKKLFCCLSAQQTGLGIKFSKNSKILISSSLEGEIKMWGLSQSNRNKLVLIKKFKLEQKIQIVQFSPCSRFIISFSGSYNPAIIVIDSQTGEVVTSIRIYIQFESNQILAISKHMDIIAYPEGSNIVLLRQK